MPADLVGELAGALVLSADGSSQEEVSRVRVKLEL